MSAHVRGSPLQGIKQPNSAHCFVCGLQNPVGLGLSFYETGPDEVTAHFSPPDHYQGYPGVLHGGIVAAILDEVGGRVVLIGDHTRFMLTATMDVKYRQPTPLGQPLRIVGRLLKRRGRLAMARAEIMLPDGTVTAEAAFTLAELPGTIGSQDELAELGWRVYPDSRAEEIHD
jgi:acyl-coenzyme A thioesterase PaaI-like protein